VRGGDGVACGVLEDGSRWSGAVVVDERGFVAVMKVGGRGKGKGGGRGRRAIEEERGVGREEAKEGKGREKKGRGKEGERSERKERSKERGEQGGKEHKEKKGWMRFHRIKFKIDMYMVC